MQSLPSVILAVDISGILVDVRHRPPPPAPWPKCPECGGPQRPKGPPSFNVRYAVETRSEANMRARWGRINRASKAHETTFEEISIALAAGQTIPERGPWFVRMTRISSRKLDDDNLAGALKAVQDTIAAVLKVDDGSPRVKWEREQVIERGFLGVIVEIWSL